MTSLEASEPEPVRDLIMQFRVLADPVHPKRAVWVSAGQRLPLSSAGVPRLRLAAGSLFGSDADRSRLLADPSEEELARILGYVEAKSEACAAKADLAVVQALTGDGWVVWEQLSSWDRVGEARVAAGEYGAVRIVSLGECLARRARLIAEEVA